MTDVATQATALITLAGDLLGLLAEFPLNIIVAGMIGGIAFKWVRGAKKVAR